MIGQLSRTAVAIVLLGITSFTSCLSAADLEPADPFAAVDGDPVFLGELSLVLGKRLKVSNLNQVPPEILRATAFVVVRQHLALQTLLDLGGDALQAQIDQDLQSYRANLLRRGTDLNEEATRLGSTENAIIANRSWNVAWAAYLKSRITDKNLRRYFNANQDRYGGKRYLVSQLFASVDSKDTEGIERSLQRMRQLADQVRLHKRPATAFEEAKAEYGSDAKSGQAIWISQPGDLPAAVMRSVHRQADAGILDPVLSPLGIHLVFVHQIETVDVSFDELTDQSVLRRDASNALLESLVNAQVDAKVQWFIDQLKPPEGTSLIPRKTSATKATSDTDRTDTE
ncbi:peptidylprolyl isomerase [Rubripirellula amarantea]|nr:peptidylprolyl isomerase [Rubripirellula amarantea]